MIQQTLCGNPVEKSEYVIYFSATVGNDVGMVGHYHIGKDLNAGRIAGFVKSLADDLFYFIGAKYRQSSVCDRG